MQSTGQRSWLKVDSCVALRSFAFVHGRAGLLSLLSALLIAPARARAEGPPAQTQMLILRGGESGPREPISRRVDAELTRALSRLGYRPRISPVPFEELQLAAGCEGSTAECLYAMRDALDTDWVLVRTLQQSGPDAYDLALFAQNGRDASVRRRALAQVSSAGVTSPVQIVPELVGLLLLDTERTQPRVAAPSPPKEARADVADAPRAQRAVNVIGWSSLAVGAALLSAGIAVGVAAEDDEAAYQRFVVVRAQDAERANDLRERAEQRARAANGLVYSAVALGAGGAALLIWNAVRTRKAERALRANVSVARGEARLTLSGPLGRRR